MCCFSPNGAGPFGCLILAAGFHDDRFSNLAAFPWCWREPWGIRKQAALEGFGSGNGKQASLRRGQKPLAVSSLRFNPNAPGIKIPGALKKTITDRICRHAEARCAGKYQRLDIRFRGDCCYIDAYLDPPTPSPELCALRGESAEEFRERQAKIPLHLCRLRFYGDLESWGLAFYTYSHERYELSMFPSGEFRGTLEEGFDVGSVYLSG